MEGLRKALDNLMGKDRNLPLREQIIKKSISMTQMSVNFS